MALIVSRKFAVVKVDGTPPPDAVLEISDGGARFAIVPAGTVAGAGSAALEDPETGELAIPTARLTLRAPLDDAGVRAALDRAGARVIRDYGRGGMIEAPDAPSARALSDALRKLPCVRSASQQILRPRAFKR